MIKIHSFIEQLKEGTWPPLVAIKTFDKNLAQLISFLALSFEPKVKMSNFQESLASLEEQSITSLFPNPCLWVLQSAPTKLSEEQKQIIEQSTKHGQKVVLLSTHDFKDKGYEHFKLVQYFSLCSLSWQKIGEVLTPLNNHCSWPSYPSIAPSIEQALDIFQYSLQGLSLEALPLEHRASLENASWLMFEQCLKLQTAEHLTYKQIFSFLNYLETAHLWFLGSESERRSLYLPLSLKKFFSEQSEQAVKNLEHFYLLALEAQQEHDHEKVKFFLSIWLKNFSQKSPSYR